MLSAATCSSCPLSPRLCGMIQLPIGKVSPPDSKASSAALILKRLSA